MRVLDDQAIQQLIVEEKPHVALADLMPGNVHRGHKRSEARVEGSSGSGFRVIVRQLVRNPSDYSVILAYELPDLHRLFRLRRHNGASHRHRNDLEGTEIEGPHIHMATERYQLGGFKEDGYAEPTDAFTDLAGAIEHMLDVAGFEPPAQTTIFSQ